MILITGASGLVGEAIFNYFSGHYKVIGTAHCAIDKRFNPLDLTDEAKVSSFFRKNRIIAVIHCASVIPSRRKENSDFEIYESNIKMLLNILKNISQNIRFINISSVAIYKLESSGKLDENATVECRTFYQLSKKHAEEMLRLFYEGTANLLNIRISSPYSVRRDSETILYKFTKSALEKNNIQLWGSGKRRQAFTNVDSFAAVIKQLYDKKISGDFNYITTSSISMLELAEKIKKYKKGLNIEMLGREDPEEDCRTDIDVSKISKFISIDNALDKDILKIIERFSK